METVLSEIWKFITSEQIVIAILGVAAIEFTQAQNEKFHKWASVCGLLSQPFWFYMAWSASAWGVFFLCILYTRAWAKGFYKHWLKDK